MRFMPIQLNHLGKWWLERGYVFLLTIGIVFTQPIIAQTLSLDADSIRKQYQIPALAFAVVSADEVLEMEVVGYKKIDSDWKVEAKDRFRIGSNTKPITGFIAAQLVSQKKISWDTRFFDLFPEILPQARTAYHSLTLLDLLSFRTRLIAYTYTYPEPSEGQFPGEGAEQRYHFANWFFRQKPVRGKTEVHFSNLGYTAAGMMLEKASGKSYQALVQELGATLGIEFAFGAPNANDSLQPWGHDALLIPEPPRTNEKLEWLMAAGNIQVSLPDYIHFIQLQLKGLSGKSNLLSQEEFEFLHFGLHGFSVGWFWQKDENGRKYSYHIGNPGTFLSKVFIYPEDDKAFIFFANAQTTQAALGLDVLFDALKGKYLR